MEISATLWAVKLGKNFTFYVFTYKYKHKQIQTLNVRLKIHNNAIDRAILNSNFYYSANYKHLAKRLLNRTIPVTKWQIQFFTDTRYTNFLLIRNNVRIIF